MAGEHDGAMHTARAQDAGKDDGLGPHAHVSLHADRVALAVAVGKFLTPPHGAAAGLARHDLVHALHDGAKRVGREA